MMSKVAGKRYAYRFDFHGLMAACQQQAQSSATSAVTDPTNSMLFYNRHPGATAAFPGDNTAGALYSNTLQSAASSPSSTDSTNFLVAPLLSPHHSALASAAAIASASSTVAVTTSGAISASPSTATTVNSAVLSQPAYWQYSQFDPRQPPPPPSF